MVNCSTSFQVALTDVQSWVEEQSGIRPILKAAGEPADTKPALCPWKLERNPPNRPDGALQRMASGYFCLSTGAMEPEAACTLLDQLHFAGQGSAELALTDAPGAGFWHRPPGLTLSFVRPIEQPLPAFRPGRVEHPPIIDLTPSIQNGR